VLTNNLTIALQNLLRYMSLSIINITGLSIGLITFLAISIYVVDEFSYDHFHEKKDRIYRAVISADFDGQTIKWGGAPNLLAPTAMKEIPEVEKATRVFQYNFGDLGFVATESEKELFYADLEVFDVFTIPLLKGNSANALNRPGTVIISESASLKHFKGADPIGKILTVDNELPLEVTGVFKDFPSNSLLSPSLLASFSSNWFGQDKNQNRGNASIDTFFLLNKDASKGQVDKKIERTTWGHEKIDIQLDHPNFQQLKTIKEVLSYLS
jgi:putative ABC transport system permease protein